MKTFRVTYDNVRNGLNDCYMDIDARYEETAMRKFAEHMSKVYRCPDAIKFKKIEEMVDKTKTL